MITGEMVLADRKARKLSMSAYAELVGLTPAKINNIEKKRAPKPDEYEKLSKFITVAGGPAASGEPVVESSPTPGADTPAASAATPTGDSDVEMLSDDDLEAELEQLVADGGGVQQTMGFPGAPDMTMTTVIEENEITPLADDGTRRFTHGEFATFKRCKRKWYLAYHRELGLPQPARIGAAPLGTRVHKALQAWYVPDGQERGNPFEVLEATIRADVEALQSDPNALAELMKEADLARAMVEGYFEWLQATGADEGLHIVGAEQRLEVPSGLPGINLLGKLDVRAVREVDQARLIIDHKTVGGFADATKWLHMREQPLHYLLLEYLDLRQQGLEHERSIGAIWNMLRKVKRTATAKPPFFDRAEVRHNINALQSYWQHLMAGLQAIEQVRASLNAGWDHHAVAYPTPTRDCTWDCDFFHVCSMMDDGSHVEEYMSVNMVHINPLKRYEPEGADN